MRFSAVLTIVGALMVIVAVSLGAHIYRWEMIIWPSCVIFWAAAAATLERRAKL